MNVRLRNLVYDWMQNDPSLKEHITISFFDDGFYIETKCDGKFTLAWISDNKLHELKTTSSLHEPWNTTKSLSPADPEYFQKLEALCRNWHNTYADMFGYGCKI